MRRCPAIPRSLTLSCAPAMSLLQCPRPSPLADAGICHLGSVPCGVGTYGGWNGGKFENDKK
ncbi:unnamed protein product [Staurois parvus]|uniref:Uncharacterized protein n=1 Tax=Staurois parvus TaxID=386267 RepID=A0ABN9CHJ3_9NEOB|nr:unnamed protein product [Staurois parvus]